MKAATLKISMQVNDSEEDGDSYLIEHSVDLELLCDDAVFRSILDHLTDSLSDKLEKLLSKQIEKSRGEETDAGENETDKDRNV
jgi:hypothetical protein